MFGKTKDAVDKWASEEEREKEIIEEGLNKLLEHDPGTKPDTPVEPEEVLITEIILDKSNVYLGHGNPSTVSLTATISPTDATNKAIIWSSNNPEIATVDSDGKVTAKGVGITTITASAIDGSGVVGTCTVTVSMSRWQ